MSNPSVASSNLSGVVEDDKGPALFGVVIGLTALAAVAVSLRLTARLWVLKKPGWDDLAIVVSLVWALVSTISFGIAIKYGLGQHINFLDKTHLAGAIRWNLIATVTFYVSLIFSRVSICFLFLRILGQTCTPVKSAFLYSMMATTSIIGIIAAGYCAGQCQPVSKDWDDSIPGKCHGVTSVRIGLALGAINAVVDFALASFPVVFLRNSAIKLKKKATIIGLMSCGLIVGIISIARVTVSTLLNKGGDFTYTVSFATYLEVAEEAASIVLACLPTFLPLVRKVTGETSRSSSRVYFYHSNRLASSNQTGSTSRKSSQTQAKTDQTVEVKPPLGTAQPSTRAKLEAEMETDVDIEDWPAIRPVVNIRRISPAYSGRGYSATSDLGL